MTIEVGKCFPKNPVLLFQVVATEDGVNDLG